MKRRWLRPLLLLAAVLLGQWLAVAHADEHGALQPADVVCAYCVGGVGPAHPPSEGLKNPPLDPAHRVPPVLRAPAPAPRARGAQTIRGPPLLAC